MKEEKNNKEKLIVTMVVSDKSFYDVIPNKLAMKLGPRQFVGNWIVSDRKEATKIIEKCYKELSKIHVKGGKLTKEYIKGNDTYVFYLNGAPSESDWVYEFYIQKEFDKDLGVLDNFCEEYNFK